jgi:hydroxymethylpyrimidine pyrophosphatase-like HAD family hydrolase
MPQLLEAAPSVTNPEPTVINAEVVASPDGGDVSPEIEKALRRFLEVTAYGEQGGVVTDLDGTVVFETQGTTLLSPAVEYALKSLYELGRPLMINSLRFPLSVLRTFGIAWYGLSNGPIPTIALNGSQIGHIRRTDDDQLIFDELAAFPLDRTEVDEVLARVENLVKGGITDILLFYYPRDWREGEIIWTPSPERVKPAAEKYRSASLVVSHDVATLRAKLEAQDICMMLLLVDAPEDTLMAYQHTRQSNFYTHAGIDKLSGARELAARIGVDLTHSIGAGDTPMDRFLTGVGLALHVGPEELPFEGLTATIRVRDAGELASVLFRFAKLERSSRPPATTMTGG